MSDEEETEDEEEKTETETKTKTEKNVVKSFKEKSHESKIMGGPRRSVSFGDVSERLFSREQDNGLLKETISEQAITSVHNGTFSQVFIQQWWQKSLLRNKKIFIKKDFWGISLFYLFVTIG